MIKSDVTSPFFSVIIPSYNREVLIADAINSVLLQSFQDFEIIIIDDGSNDNTKEVVRGFRDKRIHYKWQEGTGSPASPRNNGINIASAKWIALLDSDDTWVKEKLEECKKVIDEDNPDFICHWQKITDYDGNETNSMRMKVIGKNIYKSLLLHENNIATSSVILNKLFLDRNSLRFNEDKEFIAVEDYDMWLNIAHNAGHFSVITKYLGNNREQKDRLGTHKRLYKNVKYLQEHHARNIQWFSNNKNKLTRQLHANTLMMQVLHEIKFGKNKKAIGLFKEVIILDWRQIVRYMYFRILQRIY